MHPRPSWLVAVLAVLVVPAFADDFTLKTLRIEHPYARPTPPGARSGAVYFVVRNLGNGPERLLRVASPVAGTVELHTMSMDGTVMRMRPVSALDIPPGSRVTLGSGGHHVMLSGLVRPLAVGDRIPLTLTFDKAGSVDVTATVETAGSADATGRPH
jgi:copper(I)-binding protein